MAGTYTNSRNPDQQGCAESTNGASQAEFIGADELKARLAANNSDEEADERNARTHAEKVAPKKKKPKVKRPKPTGFEHYHADAPLTPAEHAEEQKLYHRYVDHDAELLVVVVANDCGSLARSHSQRLSILTHLDFCQGLPEPFC